MDEDTHTPLGQQSQSTCQHPLPRRTSPTNSVALRHHRVTRDVSRRAKGGPVPPTIAEATPESNAQDSNGNINNDTGSLCRNSSGESHDTGQSDPTAWFDQSNKNPTATFDSHAMDVDPPFFQMASESSNEGKSYQQHPVAPAKLTTAQSSSADEYRSVIDDLTIEIQKLKDELKRFKQKGPDTLRKDQLFEIKFHGLPGRKKRELESTLRDFAANLSGSTDTHSPDTHSSRRKKTSPRNAIYEPGSAGGSGSRSRSKHASSSSGSYNRPVDSAYASMSVGNNSGGVSLAGRQSASSRAKSSEQKVESYLRDIPEGLYPRNVLMTDKEKKKVVVRRLEHLFTGKIGGRHRKHHHHQQQQQQQQQQRPVSAAEQIAAPSHLTPLAADSQQNPQRPLVHQPLTLGGGAPGTGSVPEPSREARILPADQASGLAKKSSSRDNGSASNSGGDQTESGGNGTNTSPPNPPLPEQRPTRPKDLDPDRAQVPSENMEYIKHLGLVPSELIDEPSVHPDTDGWVYLNLLCNLAQLHIISVTPDFVRVAVSDYSAKFQLSPDGRKIRWRGGTEGTKFSSDSSGDNARTGSDIDDTDSSNKDESRKRQKTAHSTSDEFQSGTAGSSRDKTGSKSGSKFAPQVSASSESFHYKPLFARRDSSREQTSMDETLSSFGPVEDSNVGDSRWDHSGSGATANRHKRHRDGAVIYYSGAPFCTDLSGDPGDTSPMTYMMSSGRDQQEPAGSSSVEPLGDKPTTFRPRLAHSDSGSSLNLRPLVDKAPHPEPLEMMGADPDGIPGLTTDSGDDDDSSDTLDIDLLWSDERQYIGVLSLEPSGLGGVMPEDHFVVVVTTRRPKQDPVNVIGGGSGLKTLRDSDATADSILSRLESMTTSSPAPPTSPNLPGGEIEYVSGRIKRLVPVRLPPPAVLFPPFSESSSDDSDMFDSEGDDEFEGSVEVTSRRANITHSDGYPDNVDLTSGDEDGEDPDDEPETNGMYDDEDPSPRIIGRGGRGGRGGSGNASLRVHQQQQQQQQQQQHGVSRLAAGTDARDRSKSLSVAGGTNRSSAATAGEPIGGGSSGYISS
ncbi:Frequency clock protein [Geosmithia morbida]|uniref:Frequency clock protein n=1 Tax=Geosmithia morbida TaxID=1094350 RepID=A0A9P4YZY9_9HYPO|nr:Frequency clock protein [Geosmithia morbida]KAF4126158.1 Frequency clock protein [Geosmithia morbida]